MSPGATGLSCYTYTKKVSDKSAQLKEDTCIELPSQEPVCIKVVADGEEQNKGDLVSIHMREG